MSNITIYEITDLVFKPESEFPDDLFSLKQRQQGAICLHFFLAFFVLSKCFKI